MNKKMTISLFVLGVVVILLIGVVFSRRDRLPDYLKSAVFSSTRVEGVVSGSSLAQGEHEITFSARTRTGQIVEKGVDVTVEVDRSSSPVTKTNARVLENGTYVMDDTSDGFEMVGECEERPYSEASNGEAKVCVSGDLDGFATWDFGLVPYDKYVVYVSWPSDSSFADKVQYSVDDGMRELLRRSQNQSKPALVQFEGNVKWAYLGEISVYEMSGVKVHVGGLNQGDVFVADAVRLAPVSKSGLILDNTDLNFSFNARIQYSTPYHYSGNLTGNPERNIGEWLEENSDAYHGSQVIAGAWIGSSVTRWPCVKDWRVNCPEGYTASECALECDTEARSAYWWFPELESGLYEIYITWAADPSLAEDVPYDVVVSGRKVELMQVDGKTSHPRINQSQEPQGEVFDGHKWQLLGGVNLEHPVPIKVVTGIDGVMLKNVAFDAIRLVPVGPSISVQKTRMVITDDQTVNNGPISFQLDGVTPDMVECISVKVGRWVSRQNYETGGSIDLASFWADFDGNVSQCDLSSVPDRMKPTGGPYEP